MEQIRKIVREVLEEHFSFYPDFFDPQYNKYLKHYPYRTGVVSEDSIEEAAVDFSQIPDDVVLVKNETGVYKSFVLIEKGGDPYSTGRVLGMVGLGKKEKGWDTIAVAAEQGYGPLMYEIGMMGTSPEPIMPTRDADIREKAFGIYMKFYKDREDVKNIPIPKDSRDYSEEFLEWLEDGSEELNAMNSYYFKSPSSLYNNLIKKGEEYLQNSKVSREDVKERGHNYFSTKYD
jgi:hypothetical protein